MGFMVGEVTLEQVYIRVRGFALVLSYHEWSVFIHHGICIFLAIESIAK